MSVVISQILYSYDMTSDASCKLPQYKKLSLCWFKTGVKKTYGWIHVLLYVFLTSTLAEGEWSASHIRQFTAEKLFPSTHWMTDILSPNAGRDSGCPANSLMCLPGSWQQIPYTSHSANVWASRAWECSYSLGTRRILPASSYVGSGVDSFTPERVILGNYRDEWILDVLTVMHTFIIM
jgi:hypothetical protein